MLFLVGFEPKTQWCKKQCWTLSHYIVSLIAIYLYRAHITYFGTTYRKNCSPRFLQLPCMQNLSALGLFCFIICGIRTENKQQIWHMPNRQLPEQNQQSYWSKAYLSFTMALNMNLWLFSCLHAKNYSFSTAVEPQFGDYCSLAICMPILVIRESMSMGESHGIAVNWKSVIITKK